jgi:putative DNA primase/helicase
LGDGTHDRKGGGAAGERTLGSVAFTAAPRAVWAVTLEKGEDGEATGRTIFTRIKSNLGPDPGGLAYEIEPYRIRSGSEPDGIATSRIKWHPGVITKTADELYAAASEEGVKTREAPHRDEAQDFLCELLASGSKPVTEIEAEAKAAGIRRMTLRRAREKLRIVPKKKGYFPGAWHWELPQKGGVSAQPETSSNAENVEDDHVDHMSKRGDLLLEDARPPYSLKNDDHLR